MHLTKCRFSRFETDPFCIYSCTCVQTLCANGLLPSHCPHMQRWKAQRKDFVLYWFSVHQALCGYITGKEQRRQGHWQRVHSHRVLVGTDAGHSMRTARAWSSIGLGAHNRSLVTAVNTVRRGAVKSRTLSSLEHAKKQLKTCFLSFSGFVQFIHVPR